VFVVLPVLWLFIPPSFNVQLTIYTYYYLAQAWEKLDKKEKASECLHITLKKQIELNDYEPLDW